MNLKELINNFLKSNGAIVKRYPETDVVRRMKLIREKKINVIIDVGANSGQYASLMRDYGYKETIISFEPLLDAYNKLKKLANNDLLWETRNYALGNKNERAFINISGNSYSSSILDMLDAHVESEPQSKYIGQQEIGIKRLDEIFEELCNVSNNIMLKIDVQGFEKEVLQGASNSLKSIDVVQLEMSIVPLYKDEMLFCEMIKYLKDLGFELFSLENGYFNSTTGQLLQVDGVFRRI